MKEGIKQRKHNNKIVSFAWRKREEKNVELKTGPKSETLFFKYLRLFGRVLTFLIEPKRPLYIYLNVHCRTSRSPKRGLGNFKNICKSWNNLSKSYKSLEIKLVLRSLRSVWKISNQTFLCKSGGSLKSF